MTLIHRRECAGEGDALVETARRNHFREWSSETASEEAGVKFGQHYCRRFKKDEADRLSKAARRPHCHDFSSETGLEEKEVELDQQYRRRFKKLTEEGLEFGEKYRRTIKPRDENRSPFFPARARPSRSYSDNSRLQPDPDRAKPARTCSDNGRLEGNYCKTLLRAPSFPAPSTKISIAKSSYLSHYAGATPQCKKVTGLGTDTSLSRLSLLLEEEPTLQPHLAISVRDSPRRPPVLSPHFPILVLDSPGRQPVPENWLAIAVHEFRQPETQAVNLIEALCWHAELIWNKSLRSLALLGSGFVAVIWAAGLGWHYVRCGHHGISSNGWIDIGAAAVIVFLSQAVGSLPVSAGLKLLMKVVGSGLIRVGKKFALRLLEKKRDTVLS